MSDTLSPRDVVTRLLDGITSGDFDRLPDLYAEDTVVEAPLALPTPQRWEGRAAIREHFAAAHRMPLVMTAHNIVMHQTTDPEVIVAEWEYHGRVTTNGTEFRVSNIQVMRVHDGRIAWSRDYHDHAGLAAAMGRPPVTTG